jgi:hypothetical protein
MRGKTAKRIREVARKVWRDIAERLISEGKAEDIPTFRYVYRKLKSRYKEVRRAG